MIKKNISHEKMRRKPDFYETKFTTGKTYQTKCAAGWIFGLCPHQWVICPVNAACNFFPRITAQNLVF